MDGVISLNYSYTPKKASRWQAMGAAAMVEALLVGGLIGYMVMKPAPARVHVVPATLETFISLAESKPKPLPTPPKPTPAKPTNKPQTTVKEAPQPQPQTKPVVVAPAETPSLPQPTPTVVDTVASAPAAVPAPAPAVAKAQVDLSAEYAARVAAAVQAALVYPPAAIDLDFRGRARVEFHLRDGVPSQARILVSSGMGLTDRAALQAVQAASYPAPPANLQGRDMSYQVWVEFKRGN